LLGKDGYSERENPQSEKGRASKTHSLRFSQKKKSEKKKIVGGGGGGGAPSFLKGEEKRNVKGGGGGLDSSQGKKMLSAS